MRKSHVAAAFLAFGSLAALSACSYGNNRQTSSSAPAPMPSPVSSELVRHVQTTLQQQGIYRGNIDGVWGPVTQSAVQNYQQSHNMSATGQLDQATLASLDQGNSGMAPAANMQPPAANDQMPASPPAAASNP